MQVEPTLEAIYADGHETVGFAPDSATGLEGISTVHSFSPAYSRVAPP